MSIKDQMKILSQKRIEKGLLISDLGSQYKKYEFGLLPLGKSNAKTGYNIIKILDLTMDDLKKIIEE